MKVTQLKINLDEAFREIINSVFPDTTLTNRFLSATARTIYNQKRSMLYGALDALADEKGEVDVEYMLQQYKEALMPNGKLEINLKEVCRSLNWNLPDAVVGKTIILDENDIIRILGM